MGGPQQAGKCLQDGILNLLRCHCSSRLIQYFILVDTSTQRQHVALCADQYHHSSIFWNRCWSSCSVGLCYSFYINYIACVLACQKYLSRFLFRSGLVGTQFKVYVTQFGQSFWMPVQVPIADEGGNWFCPGPDHPGYSEFEFREITFRHEYVMAWAWFGLDCENNAILMQVRVQDRITLCAQGTWELPITVLSTWWTALGIGSH